MATVVRNTSNSAPALTGSTWWIHSLMIFMVICVASSFPVGKLITGGLPADVMMLIRFCMATLLFAPYIVIRHGFILPNHKSLIGYAFLSIPLVIFFWCMFEALQYTTALNTGALYTTVPLMTAVFAALLNGERASLGKTMGLVCGAAGAIWIVFKGDLDALLTLSLNLGDYIFFAGAVAISLYNPLIKRVYAGESMEVMTFWVILFGALWLFLLSAPKLGSIDWQGVDLTIYAGLLYLAVFTTLLSFFLLQLGTVRIGATKVASYSFLNPLFVLLITIAMGMTEVSLAFAPGVVLVILAMFLIQRT